METTGSERTVQMELAEAYLCRCGCGKRVQVQGGKPFRFFNGHFKNVYPLGYTVEDRGHVTPCHVWQGEVLPNGYARTYGVVDGKRKKVYAHRKAYEEKHGPIPEGAPLDHLCAPSGGPRRCVNPDHLEAVTVTINNRRGRNAKLTMETAREIRAAQARQKAQTGRGFTYRKLAELYGINFWTLRAVLSHRTWKEE